MQQQPIGVFDSGYGGLTVLKEIVHRLPQYDYIYLGDNACAPYGNRSFETVYHYTLQCVKWLFEQGCHLVILACNTASAKALRTIQQNDLPVLAPHKRVLGVIRPTTEVIGNYSHSGEVGILATKGTVTSNSYPIEIEKLFPNVHVHQHACPMWVPLIENGEYNSEGAKYFIKKDVEKLFEKQRDIDVILLACTHYPVLMPQIKSLLPTHVKLLSQGEIVASSLQEYLERHPEIEAQCSKNGQRDFYTTDDEGDFNAHATVFYGQDVYSRHINIS